MNIYDTYAAWANSRRVESAREFIEQQGREYQAKTSEALFGYALALGWDELFPSFGDWIQHLREITRIDGEIGKGADSMHASVNVKWQGLNLHFYDGQRLFAALELMTLIEMRDRLPKRKTKKKESEK